MFGVQLLAVLSVWYLQYYQSMVMNSLAVSFLPLAILSLQSQIHEPSQIRSRAILQNLATLIVRAGLVLIATVALNMTIKVSKVLVSLKFSFIEIGSFIWELG